MKVKSTKSEIKKVSPNIPNAVLGEVLSKLTAKYRLQLKEISETSKTILNTLREYYTEDYLKTFKSFDEFLEDINFVCEEGGTGKLLFIKETQSNYAKAS